MDRQKAKDEKKKLQEQLEKAENERMQAAEAARLKELEEENSKSIEAKKRRRAEENKRLEEYELRRKKEKAERQKVEEEREEAKKKADEERRKEEQAADEARRAREEKRKQALEELHKVRRESHVERANLAKELAAAADDKENIPRNGGFSLPADIIEEKHADEQKRKASYDVIKNVQEHDSVHRKVEKSSTLLYGRTCVDQVLVFWISASGVVMSRIDASATHVFVRFPICTVHLTSCITYTAASGGRVCCCCIS